MSDEACDCPECQACECHECVRRRSRYSDIPEIDAAVRELASRFERDPWANPVHADKTVAGIRNIIRVGWGKRAADGVRIVVH
jgi:hypothetical protein